MIRQAIEFIKEQLKYEGDNIPYAYFKVPYLVSCLEVVGRLKEDKKINDARKSNVSPYLTAGVSALDAYISETEYSQLSTALTQLRHGFAHRLAIQQNHSDSPFLELTSDRRSEESHLKILTEPDGTKVQILHLRVYGLHIATVLEKLMDEVEDVELFRVRSRNGNYDVSGTLEDGITSSGDIAAQPYKATSNNLTVKQPKGGKSKFIPNKNQ